MSPHAPRRVSGSLTGGDVSNPQSLNRYAYVLNNPATFVDPLGLETVNYGPTGAPPCETQSGPLSPMTTCYAQFGIQAGTLPSPAQYDPFSLVGIPVVVQGGVYFPGFQSEPTESTGLSGGVGDVLFADFSSTIGLAGSPGNFVSGEVSIGDAFTLLEGALVGPGSFPTPAWFAVNSAATGTAPAAKSGPGFQEVKNLTRRFFCGKSPGEITLEDGLIGAGIGAVEGGIAAGFIGEVSFPAGGGVVTAPAGVWFGAHLGFIDGTLKGAAFAGACSAFGLY